MSVLESGENATLKKRLAETETKLVLARYGRVIMRQKKAMSDHVMLRADGARAGGAGAGGARADGAGVGGARPAAPEITGCTYVTFMKLEQYISWDVELDYTWFMWTSSRLLYDRGGYPVTGIYRGSGTKNNTDKTDCGIEELDQCLHRMTIESLSKVQRLSSSGDCWKCGKYGKLGHKTAACWSLDRKDVTCFNCNEKGHRKRDCPKLKKNGQGGNNCGAVYKLGDVDAQQDPKVITGTLVLIIEKPIELVLACAKVQGCTPISTSGYFSSQKIPVWKRMGENYEWISLQSFQEHSSGYDFPIWVIVDHD
ncbi:putative reverse transcriptase domain-containing protein [Tanacetum coccineum]